MKKELINSLLSYGTTIYIIIVTFFCNAFYYRNFGGEIFGLIALVLLISTLVNLLDFGFSVSLLREVASSKLEKKEKKLSNLIHSIEIIFNYLILFIAIAVYIYLINLPKNWNDVFLKEQINIKFLGALITLIICIRFYSIIYRAGIIGLGNIAQYNLILIIFNSFRYLIPVLYIILFSNNIYVFFLINLIGSFLEFLVLKRYFHNKIFLIRENVFSIKNIEWRYFKDILFFSLSVGAASTFILIYSNADRIILSNTLPVIEFGYFSLLILVSSSMINIATPILTSFTPRLIKLVADSKIDEMYSTYAVMTKIITLLLSMSAMFLIVFSYDIIYLISGDKKAARWGENIFIFHVLGSSFFIINSFQYYLQNAIGKIRFHLFGSILSALLFIPLLIYFVNINGAMGAALLWFVFNTLWFCSWGILFHLTINYSFFIKWLTFDITLTIIFSCLMGLLMQAIINLELFNYKYQLYICGIIFLFMLFLGSLTINLVRSKIYFFFNKFIF